MNNIQIDEALLTGWFFLLGAAIGSFLNVVVYRLPNGMSLLYPFSHCPKCKHAIRWFDNIPIISWLVLRGRCRDCQMPISARYPLVEGLTASMFALVTMAEFTFKGINLPLREIARTGDVIISGWDNPELYAILLFHLFLLSTLLAAALIEYDRHQASLSLFIPALLLGVIMPLIYPYLHPVPAWPLLSDWQTRLLDVTAGLVAGGVLGYLAYRIQGIKSPGGMTWGLLCVGVFLGWQAVCALAILMLLLALIAKMIRKIRNAPGNVPFSVWLYTATFGWILAWSQIVELMKSLMK